MTTLTIPATYYNWVVFPKKKISPKQLESYTISVSLTPKVTKKASSDELIQEGLDAFDKWEYIKWPKKPTKSSISKLLRN